MEIKNNKSHLSKHEKLRLQTVHGLSIPFFSFMASFAICSFLNPSKNPTEDLGAQRNKHRLTSQGSSLRPGRPFRSFGFGSSWVKPCRKFRFPSNPIHQFKKLQEFWKWRYFFVKGKFSKTPTDIFFPKFDGCNPKRWAFTKPIALVVVVACKLWETPPVVMLVAELAMVMSR